MSSKIISFRFSDAEFEALETLQLPEDKSPSQTVARLVRGLFAEIEPSTVMSTSVDIRELVKLEVAASLGELRSQLEAQQAQLETQVRSQLEELRGKFIAR